MLYFLKCFIATRNFMIIIQKVFEPKYSELDLLNFIGHGYNYYFIYFDYYYFEFIGLKFFVTNLHFYKNYFYQPGLIRIIIFAISNYQSIEFIFG